MYGITDLRKETLIDLGGTPYRVTEYSHTKMGRGGATVKVKLKNLLNSSVVDKSFGTNEKIAPADVSRAKVQYLYRSGNDLALMDMQSFEQYEVPVDTAEEVAKYFPEGSEITALIFNERIIGFDLPKNVAVEVTQAAKGVKGDTASSATMPVTLETGQEVQVPLFIKQGDKVRIDTRTGQYIERAK